jgi:hypothetical protein
MGCMRPAAGLPKAAGQCTFISDVHVAFEKL